MIFAGNDGNKSQTVIIVGSIIAFVVAVVLIIISCIYLRVRKPREKPESKLINWFIVRKVRNCRGILLKNLII